MDYLQLCAYRQQCGDFVHCSQNPLCLRSVRTVKSTLFTHSCRILISLLCTCHRLCHVIQSDLLFVWNMQGKSSGKLFYLYETVYFSFFLSYNAFLKTTQLKCCYCGFFTELTHNFSDAQKTTVHFFSSFKF